MAAFTPPWYSWAVLLALVAYLAQVGRDGLAIANVALVLTMSAATLSKAWPTSLDALLPDHNAKQWAALLIVIWAGGILWLALMASGRSHLQLLLQRLGLAGRYAAPLAAGLAAMAVLLGRLVHSAL